MKKGRIFDIQKYALGDGPGIRTTVFLKGCPLRCLWCHNPEGLNYDREIAWHANQCTLCMACVSSCAHHAIIPAGGGLHTDRKRCMLCGKCETICPEKAREVIGSDVTVEELYPLLMEDKEYYDASGGGITCSGGEPLMQPEFVRELFSRCKGDGVHTALDTSGCADWDSFAQVIAFTDLVLYDIKCMDSSRHKRLTGMSNERIIANFEKLAGTGIPIIVRYPYIPGLTDDDAEAISVARYVASFPSVENIEVLPYHAMGNPKYEMLEAESPTKNIIPPEKERLKPLQRKIKQIWKER